MTKRDFAILADIVSGLKNKRDRQFALKEIGSYCAAVNVMFDWARWTAACQPPAHERTIFDSNQKSFSPPKSWAAAKKLLKGA